MAREKKITISQHMGAPGHGKGLWDGEGGVIKNFCSRALLRTDIHFENAKVSRLIMPCKVSAKLQSLAQHALVKPNMIFNPSLIMSSLFLITVLILV